MFGLFDNLLANSKSRLGKVVVCVAFSGMFAVAAVGGGLVQQALKVSTDLPVALALAFLIGGTAGCFGGLFLIWLESAPRTDSRGKPRWYSSLPRTFFKVLMLGIFAMMLLLMALGAMGQFVILFFP